MNARIWRPIVAVSIVCATLALFVHYFASHAALRQQLRQTSPLTLVLIMALYLAFVGSLALINIATLRLCRIELKGRESLLLTIYSTIINFFGPLQSGPAFRALYLSRKYGVKLKQYSLATAAYYLLYAFFSGLLLVSGLLGWWLLLLVAIVVSVAFGLQRSNWPVLRRLKELDLSSWYLLAGATFLQMVVLATIYYVELQAVLPSVQLKQALVYSGAANFALFVSLTPGAIGFRESFLLFSQQLHHVSNSVIVVANTLDRGVYIVLLLVLTLVMFGTHAADRFKK